MLLKVMFGGPNTLNNYLYLSDDRIHLLLRCNAMTNEHKILFNSVATIINMQPTKYIVVLNKLRVKNTEFNKCKFIFKLK